MSLQDVLYSIPTIPQLVGFDHPTTPQPDPQGEVVDQPNEQLFCPGNGFCVATSAGIRWGAVVSYCDHPMIAAELLVTVRREDGRQATWMASRLRSLIVAVQ